MSDPGIREGQLGELSAPPEGCPVVGHLHAGACGFGHFVVRRPGQRPGPPAGAAGTLGAVTGGLGASLDLMECLGGHRLACIGAALGGASSGIGFLPVFGVECLGFLGDPSHWEQALSVGTRDPPVHR